VPNPMRFKLTVLPGDGVGPEVTREALRVLRALSNFSETEFVCEEKLIGGAAIRALGTPLPETTLNACMNSDAVFLGAVGAPEYDHLPTQQKPEAGLLALRTALGGFANLRPAVSFPTIADCSPLQRSRVQGADILFVRELLGGLYLPSRAALTMTVTALSTRCATPQKKLNVLLAWRLSRHELAAKR